MACALVNTISRHPNFLVLGACVRCRARTLHLAEPPPPKAVVPGGWIDLTREGFCYAGNFGILSFSVMAQSLVNWPYDLVISPCSSDVSLPESGDLSSSSASS